jgi:hypothetical protein
MQSPCEGCAIYIAETIIDMDRNEVIGIDALHLSMRKCEKGVKWKGTVAYYRHHWIDELNKLSKQGRLTKREVDAHFKAYKSSVRYGNYHKLVYRLNRWYEGLWKARTP